MTAAWSISRVLTTMRRRQEHNAEQEAASSYSAGPHLAALYAPESKQDSSYMIKCETLKPLLLQTLTSWSVLKEATYTAYTLMSAMFVFPRLTSTSECIIIHLLILVAGCLLYLAFSTGLVA